MKIEKYALKAGIALVVLFMLIAAYNECRSTTIINNMTEEVAALKSERTELQTKVSELHFKVSELTEEAVRMAEAPPRVKKEVVTKKIYVAPDGKKYVPTAEYNSMVANRDAIHDEYVDFKAKMLAKIKELNLARTSQIEAHGEIVANLDAQVKNLEIVAHNLNKRLRRKWGIGFLPQGTQFQ